MSNISDAENPKYWAFISYSHKDATFGRRLHRRLENYALPRRMVGRATGRSVIPRRLAPIFRDREEFSAANDLSTEVRAALLVSRSLIVVCSPAAAASPWVAREVETFRALHPDRPVLAAIREGEPPACFPDALRRIGPAGDSIEPLAADFRKGRDGAELGLLKLVAGILGIGLDELVRRDAQRRTRRVTAVTAAALVGMLAMGLLTIFALNAQSEAEHQRTEAEGLVGFMSTDLRDKLRGVGRLDVMNVVNQRALQYYDREIGTLTPDSRAHRALLLLALGEDDETRGDPKDAESRFQESFAITAALLAADPNNAERVFDHAQSVYWMGYANYARGRFDQTARAFDEYKRLAERMIALEPGEPRYLRELAYAEGDLCSLAFRPPKNPPAALKWCALALQHMEAAAHRLGSSSFVEADLSNRHAWLGDAYHANGDDRHALTHRLIEESMLSDLMKSDPMNMNFKIVWIALQRTLARMELRAGQIEQAKSRLERAATLLGEMIVFDPSNDTWNQQKRFLEADMSKIVSNTSERR